MVKGKLERVWVFDPYRGVGIVYSLRFDVADPSQKSDRAAMAARITLGVGIDADELKVLSVDPCLFLKLTPGGGLDSFTDLDEPAGQRQATFVGRIFSPDHQHAICAVNHDAIGCERRCFRYRHCAPFRACAEKWLALLAAAFGVTAFGGYS
jgi:hypothetical protein